MPLTQRISFHWKKVILALFPFLLSSFLFFFFCIPQVDSILPLIICLELCLHEKNYE